MGSSKWVDLWALIVEAWRWPAALVVAQWQRHLVWQRAVVQWLIGAPWAGLRRSGGPCEPTRAADSRPLGRALSRGSAQSDQRGGSGVPVTQDPAPDRQAEGAARPARAFGELVAGSLALPFEMLRAQHAAAAIAGVVPMSIVESARFGRSLEAVERLALGPFARRR